MKVIAIALMLVCWALIAGYWIDKNDHKRELAEAFAAGAKHALYARPVSDELELVCAGLWMGEQDRIAMERESNGKAR